MIFALIIVTVLLFGFVVFFGAPYLPTKSKQIKLALKMLDLKKGQTVYDLGSGDGRFLLAAAKDGYKAVGYELNPLLVIFSKIITWKYRKQVKIVWGNFWSVNLSQADGVFVFLLDKYMAKLDNKLENELRKPTKLVSFAFKIPRKKPNSSSDGLFVYKYR